MSLGKEELQAVQFSVDVLEKITTEMKIIKELENAL